MAYTSAIKRAQREMRRALNGGRKPIIHICTDSFGDVLNICNYAFFGLRDGEENPNIYSLNGKNERYIRLPDLLKEHKNAWREACPAQIHTTPAPYVFGKYILTYHPENGSSIPEGMLDAMLSYAELMRTAQNQKPEGKNGNTPQKDWPQSRIVLYGSRLRIPGELDEHVDTVKVDLLSREDMRMILEEYMAQGNGEGNSAVRADDRLVDFYYEQLGAGSEALVRDMFVKISYGPQWKQMICDEKHAYAVIQEQKINRLKSHDLLEWIDLSDAPELDRDSFEYQWVMKRKDIICATQEELSIESGVEKIKGEPGIKGMLLLGGPGTGKSRSAKGVAKCLGMPLFRLTMSKILDSYVGNSDKNLNQALLDLSSVGRATLWIDEIEKALGGGSGGADGNSKGGDGLMDRLNGQLLTFQQEARQPVFIVATANSVERLLPEMFRNGRYDVRIAKMMPNYKECCAIMTGMLRSRLGINDVELSQYFVKISSIDEPQKEENVKRKHPQFLTGADIEALIKALRAHLGLPRDTYYLPKDGLEFTPEEKNTIRQAMRDASQDVTATVDTASPNTVDRIAASYVATFGESTILGGSNPVIDKKDYDRNAVLYAKRNDQKATCMTSPRNKFTNEYDEKMYQHITEAMDYYLRKQR